MKSLKNIEKSLKAVIGTNRFIVKKDTKSVKLSALCISTICLLSVTVFSCNKDHSSPGSATLMIAEGSVANPLDEISLDKKVLTSQPLNSGFHTDYLNTSAGNHVITQSEYGPGVTTEIGLASDTLFLNGHNSYSIFLWPTSTVTTDNYLGTRINSQVSFTLLVDSLSQPAAGQAKIRFVDVSLNAGSVDLVKDGNVLVSDKSTGGYSQFIAVDAATSSNFEVRENGTTVALSSLSKVAIKNGGIYTIWLYGLQSGTQGSGLTLGVINNKQY